MQELTKGHNDFVLAYNANVKKFSQALAQFDAKIGALALVVDDFVKGGVENVTRLSALDVGGEAAGQEAVGKVYWAAYIKHYLTQTQELIAKERAAAAAAEASVDPLITPEGAHETTEDPSTSDVVFGGDNDGEASSGHEATGTAG